MFNCTFKTEYLISFPFSVLVRLEAGKDIPPVMLGDLFSVTMADEPLPVTSPLVPGQLVEAGLKV